MAAGIPVAGAGAWGNRRGKPTAGQAAGLHLGSRLYNWCSHARDLNLFLKNHCLPLRLRIYQYFLTSLYFLFFHLLHTFYLFIFYLPTIIPMFLSLSPFCFLFPFAKFPLNGLTLKGQGGGSKTCFLRLSVRQRKEERNCLWATDKRISASVHKTT
jgi:hypothetical protein